MDSDSNSVTLKNLNNLEQNMMDYLGKEDSLCYKNCENMVIIIDSEINKIEFDNCYNIDIKLNGLVSGIDIVDSESITIDNSKNRSINSANIVGSKCIKMFTSKNIHNNTTYNIDNSYDIIVEDNTRRSIIL